MLRNEKNYSVLHSQCIRRQVWILFIFCVTAVLFPVFSGYAQESPVYAFIGFDKSYDSIVSSARTNGYQVKEQEITSFFGKYYLLLEKAQDFYSERIALFFDADKKLIFFSVLYTLGENQSPRVIQKLDESLAQKLIDKYGDNENEIVPYYRVYDNIYEIFLYPPVSGGNTARLSFKQLDRSAAYLDYYKQEVEKLEDETISHTVDNL
jgi:hypothetical protein